MKNTNTIIQKTIDNAYTTFADKTDEWNAEDFFFHLTFPEKIAITLGGLHNKVTAHGFAEWIDCGYAEAHLPFLRRLLVSVDDKQYPQLSAGLAIVASLSILIKGKITPIKNTTSKSIIDADADYAKLKNILSEMTTYFENAKQL